jgi:N-methylhydantoinase A/oxoprolinase/acetone carboxylase beta subunit
LRQQLTSNKASLPRGCKPIDMPALFCPAGPSTAALLAQAKDVKKACANNWAAVELKRKNWAEAASQASKVRLTHQAEQ